MSFSTVHSRVFNINILFGRVEDAVVEMAKDELKWGHVSSRYAS
jgi:hypothetical protein